MCGRLACGLKPQEICNSCLYKEPGNNHCTVPQWRDVFNSGKTFKPSYNICPKDVAPVLLSGNHFKLNSRLIVPMVFGVIPQWAKVGGNKYSTINCRIETILTSKLYGDLFKKGQRCAVICNGFFEWSKQSSNKGPHFIHYKQPEGVEVDNPKTWNLDFTQENNLSFRPLRLAALFEMNSFEMLKDATLSFTIITKEACSQMSWLHERIPAVLETDEQLDAWLNYEEIDAIHALQYIFHTGSFICVPVSNLVNKISNKDISCIKQKKDSAEDVKNENASADFLRSWLERGKKRKNSEPLEESSSSDLKGLEENEVTKSKGKSAISEKDVRNCFQD